MFAAFGALNDIVNFVRGSVLKDIVHDSLQGSHSSPIPSYHLLWTMQNVVEILISPMQ